jgi:YVTN family beta-propeller protein
VKYLMDFRFRATALRNSSVRAIVLSVMAGTIAAPLASAQTQLAPPSSGLINPRAIAFNPGTGKVYVVDTDGGAVQIYSDSDKQMHRVAVGAGPVSIAVNPANGMAYVANSGDGTVTVLDGKSDAVVATIAIGSHPYSIAADPSTGKVYATHTFGDQLTVVDGATNTASSIKTGSSDLIAINARTGTIYLLGYGGAMKVLNSVTQKLIERPVGKHAWGLTLNDATGAVYVTRIENADLAEIRPGSPSPTILPVGAIPCALAVNSQANRLYVANYGDNTVSIIDSATGRKTATIPVGRHPKAVAFDATRNRVYVANTSDGTVTVIDAKTNNVAATLPAGRNPYALAVIPGSSRLYVANEADDNPSTVVDLAVIQ